MNVDNRRYDTEAIRRRHPLLAEVRRRGIDMKPEGKAFVGRARSTPTTTRPTSTSTSRAGGGGATSAARAAT